MKPEGSLTSSQKSLVKRQYKRKDFMDGASDHYKALSQRNIKTRMSMPRAFFEPDPGIHALLHTSRLPLTNFRTTSVFLKIHRPTNMAWSTQT
jgi:hypothetical protein